MDSETTIFEESSLAKRLTEKRILGKVSVLSLVLLLVAGTVAAAGLGILLGRIRSNQTVAAFTLSVTPNPSTGSAALGTPFAFYVTVSNPGSQTASVSLGVIASCPVNGVGTLSGSAPTTLNAGADLTFDSCQNGGLQTSSQTVAGSGTTNFYFNVTYSGASGSYSWTFTAYP